MFADLCIVTAISNPERYRSRYALYRNFEKHCLDAGAKIYTIEAAFGDRPHEVTYPATERHIQLRTQSEIWHKENLLNVGISRLPSNWKYVAWVDADILFARPDWVAETIQQLQHFDVVQMFSHVVDLDPTYGLAPPTYECPPASWMYCYYNNIPVRAPAKPIDYGNLSEDPLNRYYWHPGFAWAARRSAIDALGGLVDFSVVGGADQLMAIALTRSRPFPGWAMEGSHGRWLLEWQARADRYIRGNVGFVPGTIMHNWHGHKSHRRRKRWDILLRNGFEPELDLKRDWQGLWQLTDKNPQLRDDIRQYMRMRNEDDICMNH